ncbi:MAG TPA: TatD family hydrolase [Bacteriovoracaceae bacterium]|nr:TatD family hydrolase [Bacteriovoracaceae bacterium]
MLTDTHCHLDYLKAAAIEVIVANSMAAGVSRLVTISVDPTNLDEVITIAKKFPQVACSQGIHPHDAKLYNKEVERKIIENCQDKTNKVISIGEIGLDYHYNHSSKEEQTMAFEAQLSLAGLLNLPIIIHSREAEDDTMAILKNMESKIKKCPVVFHSFTSNDKLAQFALARDFFIGINGIITFNKSDNVREIVKNTPAEKLVVETDAPFLSPVPFRGKENSPQYIPYIVQAMAKIKGIDETSLASQLELNTKALFRW